MRRVKKVYKIGTDAKNVRKVIKLKSGDGELLKEDKFLYVKLSKRLIYKNNMKNLLSFEILKGYNYIEFINKL